MRNRILNALALAETCNAEKESQRPIWELARAVRAADAKQGWRLLAHPARLRIMTIDALNGFLASNCRFSPAPAPRLNISRDAQQLYAETVLRLIERLGARDSVADTVRVFCDI